MTYAPDELLKLIHETGALSIWDRKKGPVFWYIAGVPGPFYINTEWLLGKKRAGEWLAKIDAILADIPGDNSTERATQLNALILKAYEGDKDYQRLIATMIAQVKQQFPSPRFSFISGGERRDWLFSIPFAKEYGLKHVFLFKNKTIYCDQALQINESGLHISDLINNAASYTDIWLPVLEKAGLSCAGTACIISRGPAGIKTLEDKGIKVAALNTIDLAFFERSQANGLITTGTLTEIACHFASPKEWATQYLVDHSELFDVKNADKKSFERMKSFFTADPWSLRPGHEAFFTTMQEKIVERMKDRG